MSWEKYTKAYKEYDTSEELEHVLIFNGHGQTLIAVNLKPNSIKTREDIYNYPHIVTDSHEGLNALKSLLFDFK